MHFIKQSIWSHTDHFSIERTMSKKLVQLLLMLLIFLLLPTSTVAQTEESDPRFDAIATDGITIESITDNGKYPWKVIDLNAEGMDKLGFTIPEGSKGLMAGNHNVEGSVSETIIKFYTDKTMLLSFNYINSTEKWNTFSFEIDKIQGNISSHREFSSNGQKEYKVLLKA